MRKPSRPRARTRSRTGIGLLGLCLFASGCRTAPPLTPAQADGQRVFAVGCAHCHEENDLRLKKVPPDLHGVFRHRKLPDGTPATDQAVEQILMAGKGTMPSFAYQMSRTQMQDVIAYLHVY